MTRPTKQAILDAAALQFAAHGFEGASLREILRDADVNPASAHYHFGSKEAVYRATIASRLVGICEERQQAFDKLEFARTGNLTDHLRAVIEAYVSPHLRHSNDPAMLPYLRIIARFNTTPSDVVGPIYAEFINPIRSRFVATLSKLLPEIEPDAIQRYMGWIAVIMAAAPFDSNYESMAGRSAIPSDPGKLIRRISVLGAGGLVAACEEAKVGVKGSA